MSRPFEIVTFDCYGTLIDWESGIVQAFEAVAPSGARVPSRDEILRVYAEIEPAVEAEAYRKYRDVLTEVARRAASVFGWSLSNSSLGFLAQSLPRWRPFPDTNAALKRLKAAGFTLGILSNVDDDLLQATCKQFTVKFDFWVTAEEVRSYKPGEAHFRRAREIAAGRSWLHVGQSYFHDVEPAASLGVPVVWVNRKREQPAGRLRPLTEVYDLLGLADWLRAQSL